MSSWDAWRRTPEGARRSTGYGSAWQHARALALDRAGHRCEVCGATGVLQVHYIDGRSPLEPGANATSNLKVVFAITGWPRSSGGERSKPDPRGSSSEILQRLRPRSRRALLHSQLRDGEGAQRTALRERAAELLRVGMWASTQTSPTRDALAAGDPALIYLGTPEWEFIGRAELASAVRAWTPSEERVYPGNSSSGVLLAQVEEWVSGHLVAPDPGRAPPARPQDRRSRCRSCQPVPIVQPHGPVGAELNSTRSSRVRGVSAVMSDHLKLTHLCHWRRESLVARWWHEDTVD
jgi:hypothetical protein